MSPSLTTPKMPIPEPMVVIVGMMSNFPAWWWDPGREGLTVRKGLVEKAFLRSHKARPGARGPPLPTVSWLHSLLPRVWFYMATQLLIRL